MTEQQLIENCIRGNAAAQRILYEKYSSKLYAVCLRYARNSAEAQDMLQDSFIRIFRYLPQFGGKGSLEGWMRKIVVNVALRMIQVAFSRYELPVESLPEAGEDAEVLPQLHSQELLQLIQKLPDGYRVVFNMFAIEGFSHAEIAAELDINESTSRSQLTKARKLLQKWVELHFGMEKKTDLRIAK
ncbi:MAG: RNA polymerase sigma factor [Saprospiraceae bacterium]